MFAAVDRLLLHPPAHGAAPEQLGRVYLTHDFQGTEFTQGALGYRPAVALRAE